MPARPRTPSHLFIRSRAVNYGQFHRGVRQPVFATVRKRLIRAFPQLPKAPWTPAFVKVVPRVLRKEVAFHLGSLWKCAIRRLPRKTFFSKKVVARQVTSPAVHSAVMPARREAFRSMEELHDFFGAGQFAKPIITGATSCLVIRGWMTNRTIPQQPGTAGRRPFIVLNQRPLLSEVFVLDSRDPPTEVFPGLPLMKGHRTECPTEWLGVDEATLLRTGNTWTLRCNTLLINKVGGHP